MNNGRNEVGTAGVGAGLDENAVAEAHDDARHQGPHNAAGTVFRGVGNGGQIHLVQHQQRHGEHHHIHHAAYGKRLADLHIAPDGKGHIHQQAQVAHTDTGDVLNHGTDAVQPRGGKLIGEDEQLIVQRRQEGDGCNDHIGPGNLYFFVL